MGRVDVIPGDAELEQLPDAALAAMIKRLGGAPRSSRRDALQALRTRREKLADEAKERAERRRLRRAVRPDNGRPPVAGDKVCSVGPKEIQLSGAVWQLHPGQHAEVVEVNDDASRFALRDPAGQVAQGMWVIKFRHADGTPCARYVDDDDDAGDDGMERMPLPHPDEEAELRYVDSMDNLTCWRLIPSESGGGKPTLQFVEGDDNAAPPFEKLEFTADSITVTMTPTGWYSPLPRAIAGTVLSNLRWMCQQAGIPCAWAKGDTVEIPSGTEPPKRLVLNVPPDCPYGGTFLLQPGQTRGFPWWQRVEGPGWLSICWSRAFWIFAFEEEAFEQGVGDIASMPPRKGRMPDKSRAWCLVEGDEDTWVPNHDIKVTLLTETDQLPVPVREADSVAWTDSDGDKFCFKVVDGSLVYEVNGEARPPFSVVCWLWQPAKGGDPGWISMPDIGKCFPLPREGLAEILGTLRYLAKETGVDCLIGDVVDIRPPPAAGAPAADAAAPPERAAPPAAAAAAAPAAAPTEAAGHTGEWRGPERLRWCSVTGRDEGQLCQHGFDVIEAPHWSCCGAADPELASCSARLPALAAALSAAVCLPAVTELSAPWRHQIRLLSAAEAEARGALSAAWAVEHPRRLLRIEAAARAAAAAAAAGAVCSWECLRERAAAAAAAAAARQALVEAEGGALGGRRLLEWEETAERSIGAAYERSSRGLAQCAAQLAVAEKALVEHRAMVAAQRAQLCAQLLDWEADARSAAAEAERLSRGRVADAARAQLRILQRPVLQEIPRRFLLPQAMHRVNSAPASPRARRNTEGSQRTGWTSTASSRAPAPWESPFPVCRAPPRSADPPHQQGRRQSSFAGMVEV